MVRALELELTTYQRERACLESEHFGKFVLIQGEQIAAVFDDFQTASERASLLSKGETYLIHHIGTEMSGALAFLDRVVASCSHASECEQLQ